MADLHYVINIEIKSYDACWGEDDVKHYAEKIKVICESRKIIGFYVCEIQGNVTRLIRLAIHPDYRRQGIGRTLIESIIYDSANSARVTTVINEYNMIACQFLRALDFKAVSTIKNEKSDSIYFLRKL